MSKRLRIFSPRKEMAAKALNWRVIQAPMVQGGRARSRAIVERRGGTALAETAKAVSVR
jgi:hypothetical protein